MAAFACQNRPGAAFTRSIECAAVGLLSIAVVVVAPPARSLWQIALQLLIDHHQRIDHQRVIRRTHSQPDKLEKIAADDIAGEMFAAAVGNFDNSVVRIGRRFGLLRIGRSDAHVMPRFVFHEFASVRDRPFF